MRTRIEVKDKREAELIKAGLSAPDVRAFVKVIGALKPFSSRAQARILRYVKDQLEEDAYAADDR